MGFTEKQKNAIYIKAQEAETVSRILLVVSNMVHDEGFCRDEAVCDLLSIVKDLDESVWLSRDEFGNVKPEVVEEAV